MKNDSENKAERTLSIYTKLKQGKVVNKTEMSDTYGVSLRTIQRDISDIQCFLQNQSTETGELQEIVFDKKAGGYVLETRNRKNLDSKETLVIGKILLESRALTKEEMFPIIHNLIGLCSDTENMKKIEDLLRNEMYHYVELQHGQKLLDRIWELEQAIRDQKYICVKYRKLKNKELVKRKLKPVGIMFSEFYFYLTAYIEDAPKEDFQNPDDNFPTIYRIDRIVKYIILDQHFRIPHSDRFEEGEFRKRIQFMQGGSLRKIKLKCTENSIEAVLDKFPTAEILEKWNNDYLVQVEVFGDGIDMWLAGQKNYHVERIV